MYEVEIKVEIDAEKSAALSAYLQNEGFDSAHVVEINDHYIAAAKSPFGEWDLIRYRQQGDRAFYTEKIWEKLDSGRARREIDQEVSLEELRAQVETHPHATTIKKTRDTLVGQHAGREIHVDMDSVKFDHSPEMRYFIEAEMIAQSADEVESCRELVGDFLKKILGVSDLQEAPGMFTMAFEKL